jgi:hypothetical protein
VAAIMAAAAKTTTLTRMKLRPGTPWTPAIRDLVYLSTTTICRSPRSNAGGIHRGDSGSLGPGLCRFLDMSFRECTFHALR